MSKVEKEKERREERGEENKEKGTNETWGDRSSDTEKSLSYMFLWFILPVA